MEAVKALSAWMVTNVEATLHRRDAHGTGGAGVPQGEVQRVRELVRLDGAGRRHPDADRPGRPDDPGLVGGHMWNEVYVGRWIPVNSGTQRGRDVVRPGEARRP